MPVPFGTAGADGSSTKDLGLEDPSDVSRHGGAAFAN